MDKRDALKKSAENIQRTVQRWRERDSAKEKEQQSKGSTLSSSSMTRVVPSLNNVGYPMDWNGEFQRILELPQDSEQQKVIPALLSRPIQHFFGNTCYVLKLTARKIRKT